MNKRPDATVRYYSDGHIPLRRVYAGRIVRNRMIERVWRTGLKPGSGTAYDTFAREISLPMFQLQPGFLGCIASRSDELCCVTTFWRDREAVDALAGSVSYQATVAKILDTGWLTGEQSIELREVHLCVLREEMGEPQ